MTPKLLLFLVVLEIISHGSTDVRVKITKCIGILKDPDFGKIECYVKPVSRYVQNLTMRVTVIDLPIRDFKIRFQFMNRLSGWKPFLYDFTVDCTFQRHLNKVTGFVWNHVKNITNIQQVDCPLNQSLYELPQVDNKYVENAFKMLPIPPGDYGVFLTITTNKKLRGEINFYVAIY